MPASKDDEKPFGYVASLGSVCFTAKFLEGQSLRRFKLPFDWLYSSAYFVRHALRDDFAAFLDRSSYFRVPPRSAMPAGSVGISGTGGSTRRPMRATQATASNGSRSIASSRGGTGHKLYSCMLTSPKREVVCPHHSPWPGGINEDFSSFQRAVARFREMLDQKNSRILFVLTHLVTTAEALQVVRQPQVDQHFRSSRLPVPDTGGPELASLGQIRLLFEELRTRALAPLHFDAAFLVLPPASEATQAPRTRQLCSLRRGHASLAVHELHCVGHNTGLFFKKGADTKALHRLLIAGRRFCLASLDDSCAKGYSDDLRPATRPASSLGKALRKRFAAGAKAKAQAKARVLARASAKRRMGAAGASGDGAKPKPKASQPTIATTSRGDGAPDAKRKLRILQENPKKPGSLAYKRYEKYKSAKTVAEFFKLGAAVGDLRYDMAHGFVTYR